MKCSSCINFDFYFYYVFASWVFQSVFFKLLYSFLINKNNETCNETLCLHISKQIWKHMAPHLNQKLLIDGL